MAEQVKDRDIQGDLDKLVSLGKKKGFLTYDEVNETLSDAMDSSDEIDQVFDILDGQEIKVVDSDEDGSTPAPAAYRPVDEDPEAAMMRMMGFSTSFAQGKNK